MRLISVCILTFLSLLLSGQTKTPLFLKLQEKFLTKKIKAYTDKDTLLRTSKASVHVYYSHTPGKPYLLLLHGMAGDAKTNWFRQLKALSAKYNLILPDLIYFGKSSSNEKNYSAEFQVEQLHEMLDSLWINQKIYLAGYSYGGLIAALYNQQYSSQINKLIIISGPVKFYSSALADSLAQRAGAQDIAHLICPTNVAEFNSLGRAAYSKSLPASKRFKKRMVAVHFLPHFAVRSEQIKALQSQESRYRDISYQLDKTKTLLIWGQKDGIVPISVGENLHRTYPNTTELVVFKKSKHEAHFRYSKKINRVILEFLSK